MPRATAIVMHVARETPVEWIRGFLGFEDDGMTDSVVTLTAHRHRYVAPPI
jgi:hypothetical protein